MGASRMHDSTVQGVLVRRAVQKAMRLDEFVANAMRIYAEAHGTSVERLQQLLGCSHEQLQRLALCRCPDADAPRFRAEVEQIAAYTGIDALKLGRFLREVNALVQLTQYAKHIRSGGLLIAARETPPDEED